MNHLSALSAFLLLFCGCALAEHPSSGAPARFKFTGQSKAYDVSIVALLSQPKELNGELVRIGRYLYADWEGPILFFSRENCRNYSSFDGIGLELQEGVDVDWNDYDKPNCRLVVAEGIYRSLKYKRPRENTISLANVRNILENVTYLADAEE